MIARPDVSRLVVPRYSYGEADRLAGVPRGTSGRWLSGSASGTPEEQRIKVSHVTPGTEGANAASFLDLVEIIAIGRLKRAGFSTPDIRRIVRTGQEILGVPHPLATLGFKVGGREVFIDRGGVPPEVGKRRREQVWSGVLEPFLEELDYTHELASRWWPLGKDEPIIIDPDYGYGLPVVASSGVRTEIIRERAMAGDRNEQIARDFNLNSREVERALAFELKLAA